LTDSLADDLQLSHHERADLLGNLLRRTDRLAQWAGHETDPQTVLELLEDVENSAPRFLAQSHRRHGLA